VWSYLQLYGSADAADAMAAAIKHLARLHDAEQKYHETVTRAWLHRVGAIQTYGTCRRWPSRPPTSATRTAATRGP